MANAAITASTKAAPSTAQAFGRLRLIHVIITAANLITALYLAAIAAGAMRSASNGLSTGGSATTSSYPVFGGLSLIPSVYLFNRATLIWIVWLMLFGVTSLIGLIELAERHEARTKFRPVYISSLVIGLLMGILPPLIIAWASLKRGF